MGEGLNNLKARLRSCANDPRGKVGKKLLSITLESAKICYMAKHYKVTGKAKIDMKKLHEIGTVGHIVNGGEGISGVGSIFEEFQELWSTPEYREQLPDFAGALTVIGTLGFVAVTAPITAPVLGVFAGLFIGEMISEMMETPPEPTTPAATVP